jgi:hypothetical protein
MSHLVNILADHIAVTSAVRLTTFELTFPRFILAELNTHRMLSRNSASSRAIPTEKQIQRVLDHPFFPLTFNKRVKGMGVGEEFDEDAAETAREIWTIARDDAVRAARALNDLGLDKSRANRLLEPFMWHTAIVSATEWKNFFALRNHPAAQPEFRILAEMMQEAYEASDVTFVHEGEWSLPLTSHDFPFDEQNPDWDRWKKISASRCARVSYDRHTDSEPVEDTIARAERMLVSLPPHLSSFEHVARPFTSAEMEAANLLRRHYEITCRNQGWEYDAAYADSFFFRGNFRGWVQYRKEIPNEARADLAIKAGAA